MWTQAGRKYEINRATAEKSTHTCTQGQGRAVRARANKGVNQDRPNEESRRYNPRPHTLTCIGSTTAPRHTSHETIRVRRESHKYITPHAAHTRGATNEKNKRKRCGHIPSRGARASMSHATLARPAPRTETNKGVGPTREQGEEQEGGPPPSHAPFCIGSTAAPRQATHEKVWVRGERYKHTMVWREGGGACAHTYTQERRQVRYTPRNGAPSRNERGANVTRRLHRDTEGPHTPILPLSHRAQRERKTSRRVKRQRHTPRRRQGKSACQGEGPAKERVKSDEATKETRGSQQPSKERAQKREHGRHTAHGGHNTAPKHRRGEHQRDRRKAAQPTTTRTAQTPHRPHTPTPAPKARGQRAPAARSEGGQQGRGGA